MNFQLQILKIVGAKNTIDILRELKEHGWRQYKDLNKSINCCTLNERLKQLLDLHLIEHFSNERKRKVKRIEWYELTEKGKKILQHVEEMIKCVDEDI